MQQLQDWLACGLEASATPWGTGIGALEAAEHIVACAIENGNIHPQED